MSGSPLVTPGWLRAHLGDPHVVVADVRWYMKDRRGADAYAAGHIPSACFLDLDRDLASPPGPGRPGRHPLPSADQFAGVLARIGVGRDDVVVAYDDAGGSIAVRLWWLLRYFGHDVGRVLDGGIQAWIAEGQSLDTAPAVRPPAPPMKLEPRLGMVVDKARVRSMSELGEGLLLDARAPERFEGKIEPIDARPGHIPGAKNAAFVQNLVGPGGAFRPKDELEPHFAALGAAGASPIVAYCGSGVTACHTLLALAVTGRDDALLYEGSWSEWAADPSLPAASGRPIRFVIGADEYDPVLDVVSRELRALGHDVTAVGATPERPAPWGQVALDVGRRVASGAADQGIVCCYTGTGVSMAANKLAGVRAALCVDAETAKGARQWNDANVLALSLRLTSPTVAKEIVRAWASTAYGGTEGASLDAMRSAEERKG